MSNWAAPGVKCVAIESPWYDDRTMARTEGLPPGVVYTIASVKVLRGRVVLGIWGTILDEYYAVEGFRPLITQTIEHDVELFLEIARQLPAPVKEPT